MQDRTSASGDEEHGTEGLRPGTEDLGTAGTAVDEGFTGSHRAEWSAAVEDGRMPDDGLGVPSPGEATLREAGSSDSPGSDAWPGAPGPAPGAPLLAREDAARWERRLRELAEGFEEGPRQVVEQADLTLAEIAVRFGEALAQRRRMLRASWEDAGADTERLRLALRDYRRLAARLLED
ncbi:hypothetical protein ACF073_14075 [Streptomyces sp. NPDC015171]|uniref:hypothetical protein n=1 Tax=Streptomyces sp. NPDC015171 TaxID=3364945 RepID=UPI0036FAC64B